ncbi:hypothetical protein LCGC14_2569830, partial [marine sediment metagenome]
MDSYKRLQQLLDSGKDFCEIEDILDAEFPLLAPGEHSLTAEVKQRIRALSRNDEAMALFCEWAPEESDPCLFRLNRALANLQPQPAT